MLVWQLQTLTLCAYLALYRRCIWTRIAGCACRCRASNPCAKRSRKNCVHAPKGVLGNAWQPAVMRDMPLFNTAAGLGSFAWCESPDAHLKPALDGLCKERPESRQESHVSLSADLLGQVAEVCTRFR